MTKPYLPAGFTKVGALVNKKDAKEFKEYCKTIDSTPNDVIYAFIRAVLNGEIHVMPAKPAPYSNAEGETRE